MRHKEGASVVFLDGCVIEEDTFFFSTRLNALPEGDYHHARISAYRNGDWYYQDRSHEVVSVCVKRERASEPQRASCTLERMSGKIGFYWKGETGARDEKLPGKEGSFGPMSQIVQVGDAMYCCGVDASVYKRESGQWTAYNQGLDTATLHDGQAAGRSLGDAISLQFANQAHLLGIAGCGNDLYVCGLNGLLYHRNVSVWKRLDILTNAGLTRIKCVTDDEVYVVGHSGVLLKGNTAGFHVLQTDVKDDFRCVEWFKGALYVGGYKGLYILKNDKLHSVAIKDEDGNHVALNAFGDQLLAVSERSFKVFDGKSWKTVPHPDN